MNKKIQTIITTFTIILLSIPTELFAKEVETKSVVSNIFSREVISAFLVSLVVVAGFTYTRTKNKMIKEKNRQILERQAAAKKAKKQAKKKHR
ncbi:hypothetical protein [Mycoplasma sp. P36-A1]|uniref:hypothetical protein n=1 Tax=Mycoplasma sp. P36-A1 TaxID=3252900 RepID=UPI003C2D107F